MTPEGRARAVPDRPIAAARPPTLGGALRRAWVGYQRQLDAEMSALGFGERRFPDGRVLRICSTSPDITISQIGRELGITRQGASKIVADLAERGFVTLRGSPTDGREKMVRLTPSAIAYLEAHRQAARKVDRRLRATLGPDGFAALQALLVALDAGEQPRLRQYLGASRQRRGDPMFGDA